MKVVALAGGTGSAKLLRGLSRIVSELTVVANVGDNFWVHGLYVCPDVDIATYALAGLSDPVKGWGLKGDTFNFNDQLAELGQETWFRLGDKDLATSVVRTELLKTGVPLTEVTRMIGRALGARHPVLPSTDSRLETWVRTRSGSLHLQEFWVRDGGRHRVTRVEYRGARSAMPSAEVKGALAEADRVVLCPANPITSIGPILAVKGMRKLLSRCGAEVVAVSPMVGAGPYSGPAGKLMRQLGIRPDSVGVASLYSDFLDRLVVDRKDSTLGEEIEKLGVACTETDTLMRTRRDETRLASVVLRS